MSDMTLSTDDQRTNIDNASTIETHVGGSNQSPLLRVRELRKHYLDSQSVLDWIRSNDRGRVRAVDGVSFDVQRGETVGIVGESGCGKSTLARTVLGLHEPTAGTVELTGQDVHKQIAEDRKRFARRVQIVFQDPSSCLDPRMTLREIVREPLDVHDVGPTEHRNERVSDLVERVGLSTDQLERYPSEFSGGQRQRIGIARALALDPELLVLDEPTSALDVSVQAQILNLLEDIQNEFDLTYLFISHDLSVIRHLCDKVVVMYLGQIAEIGSADDVFDRPAHPYTKVLLGSAPSRGTRDEDEQVLNSDVPSPRDPPEGCRFHTRCPAVLPSEDFHISQDEWQAVFDYKLRLQSGRLDQVKLEELADRNGVSIDNSDVFRDGIREWCSLPDSLSDDAAERALKGSISALAERKVEKALSIVNANFTSPCERKQPPQVSLGDNHSAVCLLAEGHASEK